MDKSEDQFQELIANLICRINKVLEKQDKIPCIGLLLSSEDEIELVVTTLEDSDITAEVSLLQKSLIKKSKKMGALAVCMSYPDYDQQEVVAYFENSENYCSKIRIPVISGPSLLLDVERMEIEDGLVFVFGENAN